MQLRHDDGLKTIIFKILFHSCVSVWGHFYAAKSIMGDSSQNFFFIYWGKWTRTGAVISSHCLRPIDLTWKARWKRIGKCSCALANRQAGELMMVRHQGVARGCYTRADMAGSPHLPEDRAPPLLLTMCLFNKSGMTFSPTSIWLRE